jgi:hypothetical protein
MRSSPPLPDLINPNPEASHPSYQAVDAMVRAWRRAGGAVIEPTRPSRIGRKLLGRRAQATTNSQAVLIPLVGPQNDWIPLLSPRQHREIYLFCWDTWPSNESRWHELFDRVRPRKIFMTTSSAVHAWGIPGAYMEWMPDATDVSAFDPSTPLTERSIDVLELGRRWGWLHDAITVPLSARGARHLYQPDDHTVVFPTAEGFTLGIQDSKCVVCVPGSVTHPEKCGEFSALTPRYLETMAAGAIPVGLCPPDLREVMGYNPVVEVDRDSPVEVFNRILDDPGVFLDASERNRIAVEQRADWRVRIEELRNACTH